MGVCEDGEKLFQLFKAPGLQSPKGPCKIPPSYAYIVHRTSYNASKAVGIRFARFTFSDASLIHPTSSYLISLSHIIFKNIAHVGSLSHFVFVLKWTVAVMSRQSHQEFQGI